MLLFAKLVQLSNRIVNQVSVYWIVQSDIGQTDQGDRNKYTLKTIMEKNAGPQISNQGLPLPTPKALGYCFPAEFAPHQASWLSWPHKEASWPGKIESIYPSYCLFVKELTKGELVRINVGDEKML